MRSFPEVFLAHFLGRNSFHDFPDHFSSHHHSVYSAARKRVHSLSGQVDDAGPFDRERRSSRFRNFSSLLSLSLSPLSIDKQGEIQGAMRISSFLLRTQQEERKKGTVKFTVSSFPPSPISLSAAKGKDMQKTAVRCSL